ncbi:MAG TPA: phosphatase PAP2 family protein [Chloroflexota bacterium]|nr:phosphatase PAP2 family protein [Chloroflexota bacterium]
MAFLIQVLIAVSIEVGDDLGRGIFSQRGTVQGIDNARRVVAFEAAHGFWIEPAWQTFFLHTHRILTFTVSYLDMAHLMNGMYVFGHIFVTLGVAIWVYFYRREHFRLVRNTVILTNALALLIYETFPVAPPRMTTNLLFDHHPFHFTDTLYGILSGGKIVGTQLGYNEFSAMPSIHMAWALIAAGAVVVLSRRLLPKLLAFYPALMLLAVVVTGNHYLLDAMASVPLVALAFLASAAYEVSRGTLSIPWRRSLAPAQT